MYLENFDNLELCTALLMRLPVSAGSAGPNHAVLAVEGQKRMLIAW